MELSPALPTPMLISTMVERIVAQFKPAKVILFGSQARGDAGPNSDVDLLIVVDSLNGQRKIDLMAAVRDALDDLMIAKDIVVATLEEVSDYGDVIGHVIRSALKEGKVVYDIQPSHQRN